MSDNKKEINVEVLEGLGGGQFKVKLEDEEEMRVYLSGKMRRNKIRVLPGDILIIEIDPNMRISNQVGRIIRRK